MHKNPNTPNALPGNPQRPRDIPDFDRAAFIALMNAASMPKDRFDTTDEAKAMSRIEAALSAPKTHRVKAVYECGKVYTFETRSEASAENHAVLWRRKIGRELISHETREIVKVVSVEVERIA